MQITVTARQVDASDEIKDYARDKAEKLLRFYDRIQSIEVVLGHESELFTVEMLVNAGARHEFIAQEKGPDTRALIDVTVDKLERQLTKYKEKMRNHMHVNKKPPAEPS